MLRCTLGPAIATSVPRSSRLFCRLSSQCHCCDFRKKRLATFLAGLGVLCALFLALETPRFFPFDCLGGEPRVDGSDCECNVYMRVMCLSKSSSRASESRDIACESRIANGCTRQAEQQQAGDVDAPLGR
jgi:hypothetical protein